jgi:hypothetical protein
LAPTVQQDLSSVERRIDAEGFGSLVPIGGKTGSNLRALVAPRTAVQLVKVIGDADRYDVREQEFLNF